MKKSMLIAAALLASGLAWTSAQAGDVYWSLGINAPLDGVGSVGTVVGNYPHQPVMVMQAPDYYGYPAYQPAYQPVYRAPPVVYYPDPVRIAYPGYMQHHPRWGERENRHFEQRRHERREEHRDDRRDERRDDWRDDRHRGD